MIVPAIEGRRQSLSWKYRGWMGSTRIFAVNFSKTSNTLMLGQKELTEVN